MVLGRCALVLAVLASEAEVLVDEELAARRVTGSQDGEANDNGCS